MRIITPAELKARMDKGENFQIIDIRESFNFSAGHIEGSLNICQRDIPDNVHQIQRVDNVVIVCAYGMKSDQVYIYLREKHKYKNLMILEGGLYDWAAMFDPKMVVF
ncbi:MAG: rhodanese-like domain-containing protein [Bacteroidales bacterium]